MQITEYNTPAAGEIDWHIPLNENFDAIETDIQSLANEVGVSVVGGYDRPSAGTVDWHIPLNENFDAIETDVQSLANEVGVSDTGGYNRPSAGTVDWHTPLNENFKTIYSDLSAIADAAGVSSLSGMKTLSTTDIWHSLSSSSVDTTDTVYDATTFAGSSLAQQVKNALSTAQSDVDGRAVIQVPNGTYEWDQIVKVATGDVWGPMFLFGNKADITVTSNWAFDFNRGQAFQLTNDTRTSPYVRGGRWNIQSGWIRATDIYRGFMSPVQVSGGERGIYVDKSGRFSEGWTVRDAVFDGVDKPIHFDSGSADQQLLANLTFRDFNKAVYLQNSSGQNYTAAELRFENPRSGAVGMHFGSYTTGTIYHPQWPSSNGTVFRFGDGMKPSIVEPEVAADATFSVVDSGGDAIVSSGVSWQQGHQSPTLTQGGPTIPTPVVRTDAYSGSLPNRIENGVADLPDGGTVLVPGRQSYTWDTKASISLAGRNISIVTPPNVDIDVTTSDWALDVTGNGSFGSYGGFWRGNDSSPGWLTTNVPNLDASPSEVRNFGSGSGIDARPQSKGRYRVYDLRFIHTTSDANDPSSVACVHIGGAGCAHLQLSHIETENIQRGYRFDAPIDNFDGIRLSAHPWNDGAIFAESNSPVDGTWFNPKWEAPGRSNTVVFSNNTASPAAVVEPWAWAQDETVELWQGTEPQFFPEIDTRVSTAHVP